MVKCEVIKDFRLKDFDKLKILTRKNIDVEGKLFAGDVFECDSKMAEYLTGNNKDNEVVIKVVEVEPEEIIEEATEDTKNEENVSKKETTRNRASKKKSVK